jgi:transposase-like protein
VCGSPKTIRKGLRRGKVKYVCKDCGTWFQINRAKKQNIGELARRHLDGISFRSLMDDSKRSLGSTFEKILQYLDTLPHCADITRRYTGRWSGILVVDGKYVKVKGYEKKIPYLYGIDFLVHDIPTYRLLPSENYLGCLEFFKDLRLLSYPLISCTCDDNENIRLACLSVFPNATIQLCQTHYLENIRKNLGVRSDPTYESFVRRLEYLFHPKRSEDDFNRVAKNILNEYKADARAVSVMVDIHKRKALLLGYLKVKHCPKTSNIIECFNSHVNGRLESHRGFKTFQNANDWINGWIIRRRTKRFTCCKGQFKKLNGKTPLELSKKSDVEIPAFF